MEDLRVYSSQELSLKVFNEKGLYNLRNDFYSLIEVINQNFIYNSEQLKVLEEDLREDLKEKV